MMNEQSKNLAIENFKKWCNNHPLIARDLTEDLEMMAGCQSPNDLHKDDLVNWALEWKEENDKTTHYFIGCLSISELDKAELGTFCGTEGNIALSCTETIAFLKKQNIQEILFIALEDDLNQDYCAVSGALPIDFYNEDTAEELFDVVQDNEGSFRPDCCSIKGWTVFESE